MVLALLAVVSGALPVTIPCCLPMIPAYLSYVSGASDGSPGPQARSAALRAALVFVAGFAVVFVTLGASLGVIGPVLVRALPGVERVAGVVIIAIGLRLTGVLRSASAPPLAAEAHGLYAAGFGIPFVAMALGLHRATTTLAWLRGNLARLQAAGGVLLVGVGVLFVTGAWRTFFIPVAARLSRLGWPPI